MTKCPECNDTGERDSGGTHPWGEPVYLPCDCKDAEIGRRWREDSSLEKWFPITAERLAAKERENLHLAREARTWWEAAQTYAADGERLRALLRQALDALEVESAWGGPTPKGTAAIASLREALGPNARANARP